MLAYIVIREYKKSKCQNGHVVRWVQAGSDVITVFEEAYANSKKVYKGNTIELDNFGGVMVSITKIKNIFKGEDKEELTKIGKERIEKYIEDAEKAIKEQLKLRLRKAFSK